MFSWVSGIWVIKCTNNIFENNTILKNFHGITLDYSSIKNTIRYNNLSENRLMGVMIESHSNKNIIEKNNFLNNNKNYSQGFLIS